jgi:type VI protein secretion system component VasF
MFELLDVVVAALARPVQEEHQRIPLAIASVAAELPLWGFLLVAYTVGGVMAYLGFAIMLAAQSATEEFCKLSEHKVFKLLAVALTVVFGTIGIFVC